jgi:hypothetical protein
MFTNKYDELNYDMVDDIKIYTGTTQHSLPKLKNNIDHYKSMIFDDNRVFTELVPSTLTAKGKLSNVCFNEEDIIDMITIPTSGDILQICCNYGEIKNLTPAYIKPIPRVRTSNRGRKPKDKPKSKRKLQGSGKYFSSQITYEIYNKLTDKIYKIKNFRNGGFQVPGIRNPDMKDLIHPIITLRDYLRGEFVDDNINVEYFVSVMRNYICRIKNERLLIRLNDLETLFKTQKDMDTTNPLYEYTEMIYKDNVQIGSIINEYIGKKNNAIGIAEIQNNCERYFGLIIKFYRPVPWKITKKTTIKILRSGKINIDGANSVEEAYELYYWLESIFIKYADTILYNPLSIEVDSEDYDIGSGESVYDSSNDET